MEIIIAISFLSIGMCMLVFVILKVNRRINSIGAKLLELNICHNISVYEFAQHIKYELQQIAKTRDLNEDEKEMFTKAHQTIHKVEEALREAGVIKKIQD